MNVGFWFDYDYTYFFIKLFYSIREKHAFSRASGFVVNDRYLNEARTGLPAGSSLVSLYELVARGCSYQYSREEYAEFCRMDEQYRFSRIAYSDRHISKFEYRELIALYIYLVKQFREYVRRERPDVFVFNCVASQYAHLCYLVLREEGVRTLIPFYFGIEDLFYFSENPYFECPDVAGTYKELLSGSESISAEEEAWAKSFIARVLAMRPAYELASVELERQRFELPSPKRIVRYLYNYLTYYRSDPTLPGMHEKIMGLVRYRLNRYRAAKLFVSFEEVRRTPFIYYPLHFEPEIATLIFSQYDQTSVIDIVARQLPLCCRLVVKEHPAMVGQRKYDFYDRIVTRYPNVIFADPCISSVTLVSAAKAVLTLSGTVILESWILGRPVIYTSRSRFGSFGLGTYTEDLLNFHRSLEQAGCQTVTTGELVAMLTAIRRHCYRIKLAEPLGTPDVLSDTNIRAVTDAVLDWIHG